MDSILDTVKKANDVDPSDTSFDHDIILFTNAAIFEMELIGVPVPEGFVVTDNFQTWDDYLGPRKDLEAVKTCIALKVRMLFDPPTTSYLIQSINELISKYEWQIRTKIEQEVV